MFCPRCRKFTDAPPPPDESSRATEQQQAASPATLESLDSPADKPGAPLKAFRALRGLGSAQRCADCGTLLTLNRLAAEFPDWHTACGAGETGIGATLNPAASTGEPIQDAVAQSGSGSASGAPSDKPITVQEILRATAGPNPISGVGQIPLDQRQHGPADRRIQDGGRRSTDDIPLVGSRYQASETANRRNQERRQREMDADWRRSDSPRIPRGFGRKPWFRPNVEVVLGIGTLASVALLIVSMTLRVLTAPNAAYGPAPHPTAQVVSASTLGYVPPATLASAKPTPAFAADPFAATPALVANDWRRVGQPASVDLSAPLAPSPGRMDIAAYDSSAAKGTARVSPVRIWVQHLRSSADAMACLSLLAQRRASLQADASGLRASAIRWEMLAGRRTAVFDNDAAGIGAIMSDRPGEVALSSMRAWQQGSDVVTVAAIDAASRDQFVRDYLSQAS